MDLRQLEMLLAVEECGSYLKAGERLHVSHSAIHRQIRMLEHELQDRVLARVGQHVKVTETGRILLSLACRIRQDISNAQRQIGELNQLHSGHLRLGTGTSVLASFLPPILERFRQQFPKVQIQVLTGTADQIIEEIHNDSLDLGIVFSPTDNPKGKWVPNYELLYREELVLAVGKRHPLAKRKTIALAQLQDLPINMYTKTSHTRRLIERVFQNAGILPIISMEVENEEAMAEMIKINMGMAFISKRRAIRDRLHYLRIIDQPIHCEVGAVFPQVEYIPRAVKEFVRFCHEGSRVYEPAGNKS